MAIFCVCLVFGYGSESDSGISYNFVIYCCHPAIVSLILNVMTSNEIASVDLWTILTIFSMISDYHEWWTHADAKLVERLDSLDSLDYSNRFVEVVHLIVQSL